MTASARSPLRLLRSLHGERATLLESKLTTGHSMCSKTGHFYLSGTRAINGETAMRPLDT